MTNVIQFSAGDFVQLGHTATVLDASRPPTVVFTAAVTGTGVGTEMRPR